MKQQLYYVQFRANGLYYYVRRMRGSTHHKDEAQQFFAQDADDRIAALEREGIRGAVKVPV